MSTEAYVYWWYFKESCHPYEDCMMNIPLFVPPMIIVALSTLSLFGLVCDIHHITHHMQLLYIMQLLYFDFLCLATCT